MPQGAPEAKAMAKVPPQPESQLSSDQPDTVVGNRPRDNWKKGFNSVKFGLRVAATADTWTPMAGESNHHHHGHMLFESGREVMNPNAISKEEARQAPFLRLAKSTESEPGVFDNAKFETLLTSSPQQGSARRVSRVFF